MPLANDPTARKNWQSSAYVQLSESICGRAIRTAEWIYCAYDPSIPRGEAEYSKTYTDFALYSIEEDPYQQVNLVGRESYRIVCNELREQLRKLVVAHGEPEPTIAPMLFYA